MENKAENVQIPKSLFLDLVNIVCMKSDDTEIWERAADGLQKKINAMANRQRYTAARTEAHGEKKQKLWEAYADGKK